MKLHTKEIIFLNGGSVFYYIIAFCNGELAVFCKIAVHIIDVTVFSNVLEKRRLQIINCIPSHLGNLYALAFEFLYINRYNVQASRIRLFRMIAQQLHTN